jgi:glycine dehydrogenase subunit 1
MPYISNTDSDRKEMLSAIGVSSFQDLISYIPEKLRKNLKLNLEEPYSEMEITRKMYALASKNLATHQANSFLGAGIYDHFIPAVVNHVVSRPEFYTAYTPYQAEVSQGTLQYIYEYQSMIAELTGMDISNAGMYDGASASAEAILMAVRKTRKNKALVAGSINPLYLEVIHAYTKSQNIEIITTKVKDGTLDLDDLKEKINDDIACVLVQTPNFFGNIEDMFEIDKITHSTKKALLVAVVDPISLAILNSPAEYNADIVVGEGQILGNSQYFGGPLFGFMATKQEFVRSMPGRIVGATEDVDGNRGYVLTLQAREQHIRRAKATSNICSNEALVTLAATVYMAAMGKEGLKEAANQSTAKAHYLANEISKLQNVKLAFDKPFFKEFTIKTETDPQIIIDKLIEKNIFAGLNLNNFGLGNMLLIAVTEKKTKKQMDDFVKALSEVTNG